MTDEQHHEEGADEAIEDLEAPAAAQSDIAGGAHCLPPSCARSTDIVVACSDLSPSCAATAWDCSAATKAIIIHAQ
jgi:hypothetical protein